MGSRLVCNCLLWPWLAWRNCKTISTEKIGKFHCEEISFTHLRIMSVQKVSYCHHGNIFLLFAQYFVFVIFYIWFCFFQCFFYLVHFKLIVNLAYLFQVQLNPHLWPWPSWNTIGLVKDTGLALQKTTLHGRQHVSPAAFSSLCAGISAEKKIAKSFVYFKFH